MSALQVEFVEFDTEPHAGSKADPAVQEFASALRANPGRWGKWPRPMLPASARNRASDINSGIPDRTPKALRGGNFEARTHKGELYVRYVGETA